MSANWTSIQRAPACLDTARINSYVWDWDMQDETGLYFISMAARLLDMHPQTLRKYERLGLVRPERTLGSMRLYSADQIERLRLIKYLVEDAGVNLAGVQRLLSIAEAVQRIQPLISSSAATRQEARRLAREIARIGEMAGL